LLDTKGFDEKLISQKVEALSEIVDQEERETDSFYRL